MKILIICTGNTCRSQMAETYLQSFAPNIEVFSAGTKAEAKINPRTVIVMAEEDFDLSGNKPKSVYLFLKESFYCIITVCDSAKETYPVFTGNVNRRLHIGFEDPADYKGSDEEVLPHYRRIRNQIKDEFYKFYLTELKNNL